jgi:hypothetical protein
MLGGLLSTGKVGATAKVVQLACRSAQAEFVAPALRLLTLRGRSIGIQFASATAVLPARVNSYD